MVSLYIFTYNDEHIIKFCIEHYIKAFKGHLTKIIVYDNFSTDRTLDIARKLGAFVVDMYTGEKMDDQALTNAKNRCWKTHKPEGNHINADWVIVCDADELLQVDSRILHASFPYTVLNAQAVNMVGMHDTDTQPEQLIYGVHYDHEPRKMLAFRRDKVIDINYGFGCHEAMPTGHLIISKAYEFYHYKYISPSHIMARNNMIGPRLSALNKKRGLSFHYKYSIRKVLKLFRQLRKQAKLISA